MARRTAFRRGGGGGGVPRGNDVRRRADWVVGGQRVDSAGATAAATSWSDTVQTIGPLAPIAYQLVTLPAVNPGVNAPPSIGECQVDEVFGSVFFEPLTNPGVVTVGVGIFVAKYATVLGTWEVRNPCQAPDAQRDDWLFLRPMVYSTSTATAGTGIQCAEVRVALAHPIILCGGEALHLVVAYDGAVMTSIGVRSYVRTRVSQVA